MKAITILLLLIALHRSESYHILGLFPLPSRSHMVMFESLMKGLAAKGHEVDVLSHFPLKNQIPRYHDISIRGTLPILVNNVSVSLIRNNLNNPYNTIKFMLIESGIDPCKAVFNSNVGQELLNSSKKYDLVIAELFGSDCMLGFAHHFKVPIIGITSSVSIPWGGDRIGNPDNPSYIPNYLVPYLTDMSLIERFINTVVLLGAKLGHMFASYTNNAIAREFFGPDLPDLRNLAYNTSLILVNSHFSINHVRPMVPNFIEVGGLHIEPPKPLSKRLEDSVNVTNSKYKGVIYLSMGSMVLTETLPPYKLEALFEAFRDLPYKILWKAVQKNMPKNLDIPSNIQFEPWLPQLDILCHPNVKLFVAHGGLLGTQESVYCGVPRLGIPFFADQELNLKTSEAMGLAILIEYDNITKESILDALNKLLENPKYQNNAEKVSKIFRDRPLSPMDTAVYWVEYAIKHCGAPHLRAAGADLYWYQYLLLDIALMLLMILLTIIFLIYYLTVNSIRTILISHKTEIKDKRYARLERTRLSLKTT